MGTALRRLRNHRSPVRAWVACCARCCLTPLPRHQRRKQKQRSKKMADIDDLINELDATLGSSGARAAPAPTTTTTMRSSKRSPQECEIDDLLNDLDSEISNPASRPHHSQKQNSSIQISQHHSSNSTPFPNTSHSSSKASPWGSTSSSSSLSSTATAAAPPTASSCVPGVGASPWGNSNNSNNNNTSHSSQPPVKKTLLGVSNHQTTVPRQRPSGGDLDCSALLSKGDALLGGADTCRRCRPLLLAPSSALCMGVSSSLSNKVCSKLRCTNCDFSVEVFEDMEWTELCDYMYLRNFMPDRGKVQRALKSSAGCRAFACQCSWQSVPPNTSPTEPAKLNPKLRWVCGGHS